MRYAIACLLQAVLLTSCSPDAIEPQKRDDVGLIFPQRIDFPPTRVGSTSIASVGIRNEGGTTLEAWLEIPEAYAPFTPRARRLELAPREERTVRLLFRPSYVAGQFDTIAYLHSGGDARPLWLLGQAYYPCEDACTVRAEVGGPCVPAPEGMACGDASECSDGAFCRSGACEPAPERSGSGCVTDCGSEGSCASDQCLLDAEELEAAWTWESQVDLSVVHTDPAGTLIEARQPPDAGEFIRLDQQGRRRWRRPMPEGFRTELPTYEGLLFASSRHDWAAYDIDTGEVRWRRAKDEQRWYLLGKSTSLLVFYREASDPDQPPAAYLQGVDPLLGDVLWTREILARTWSVIGERLVPTGVQLALHGEELRLASGGAFWDPDPGGLQQWRYALFALDPATGNERWARAGGLGAPHMLQLDATGRTFVGLFLGYLQGEVHAFDAAGERMWSRSTGTYDRHGNSTNGPVRVENDIVLLQDRTALDADDGTVRYVAPVAVDVAAGGEARTAFGRLWVDLWVRAVVGFDLESGEQRFSLPVEPSRLYSVEGAHAVRFVQQRYQRAGPVDSSLCTIDAAGKVLNERQLPALPDGDSYRHIVTPQHWIRWVERDDGTTRLEAWPLPD